MPNDKSKKSLLFSSGAQPVVKIEREAPISTLQGYVMSRDFYQNPDEISELLMLQYTELSLSKEQLFLPLSALTHHVHIVIQVLRNKPDWLEHVFDKLLDTSQSFESYDSSTLLLFKRLANGQEQTADTRSKYLHLIESLVFLKKIGSGNLKFITDNFHVEAGMGLDLNQRQITYFEKSIQLRSFCHALQDISLHHLNQVKTEIRQQLQTKPTVS